MTCLVALRTSTSIALAGDGLITAGEKIISRTDQKYVELPGGWVIANSGLTSFRGIVLQGREKLSLDGDVYSLCDSIRAYLKEVGYLHTPQPGVGLPGYDLGIAIIRRETHQSSDHWTTPGIWIASGGDIWPKDLELGRPYGLGSGGGEGESGAWVAYKGGASALEAVTLGVEAAIEYDLNSGGRIWSLEIGL